MHLSYIRLQYLMPLCNGCPLKYDICLLEKLQYKIRLVGWLQQLNLLCIAQYVPAESFRYRIPQMHCDLLI